MNLPKQPPQSILNRVRRFSTGLLLAIVLGINGCATQRAVRDIVAESNMASLSEDWILGAEDPSKPQSGGNWEEASKKIEAFIAAHPENSTTIAHLRLRQAILLLNNKKYNLAEAAFGQVTEEQLQASSRDRALKQLQGELLWWYPISDGSMAGSDYRKASNVLVRISSVRAPLVAPKDEGIRDWLAALRAWVGLKMAVDADADLLGKDASQQFLEEAINTYARMLPPGETDQWRQVPKFPPEGMTLEIAFGASNRRRFRSDDLIAGARKAIQANAITHPAISDAYFRDRILQ